MKLHVVSLVLVIIIITCNFHANVFHIEYLVLEIQRTFPILYPEVVQSDLLDPHGRGRGVLSQEEVVAGDVSKLGVRPLVSHSSNTGQVSEGQVGWREHSLELITGHVAVEQVISERGLLVEPGREKYFTIKECKNI